MLFTTDLDSSTEAIISRYAGRWSIEVAIETAKGPMSVGQATTASPTPLRTPSRSACS
jgi:hypothetical protein